VRIRTRTDLKTDSFAVFGSSRFVNAERKAHTELLQLNNPCLTLLTPPSVTCKYHPQVLERLHLLQCIAARLQHTLPWVCREAQYLGIFSADFAC